MHDARTTCKAVYLSCPDAVSGTPRDSRSASSSTAAFDWAQTSRRAEGIGDAWLRCASDGAPFAKKTEAIDTIVLVLPDPGGPCVQDYQQVTSVDKHIARKCPVGPCEQRPQIAGYKVTCTKLKDCRGPAAAAAIAAS